MENISKISIFEYGKDRKIKFVLLSVLIIGILILSLTLYFALLKDMNLQFLSFIGNFIGHIKLQITNAAILGILYAAIIGGLFFVTIPTEILFINFLRQGANPYLAVLAYVVGFAVSHTINYIIGKRLNTVSKKIITPKKFYKVKGLLNKYGATGIFLANAIPFLPSQPLSAIIGVFNYNKAKFYIYLLSGQLVKFTVIALVFTLVFV